MINKNNSVILISSRPAIDNANITVLNTWHSMTIFVCTQPLRVLTKIKEKRCKTILLNEDDTFQKTLVALKSLTKNGICCELSYPAYCVATNNAHAYVKITRAFALQFGKSSDDKIGNAVTRLVFWLANVNLIVPDSLEVVVHSFEIEIKGKKTEFQRVLPKSFLESNYYKWKK